MNIKIFTTKVLYQLLTVNRKKYEKSYLINEKVNTFENINYSQNRDKNQVLDIFVPDTKSQSLPVIVHIHGGGWTLGDKKDVRGYCKYLASKGYVTIAINYNLAPKTPHPKQEKIVLEALKWISSNVSKYNGNPQKIFLSGDSAGAHLATVAATICTNELYAKLYSVVPPLEQKQIAGLILFYGVYDFNTALYSKFPLADVAYASFLGTKDVENNREMINKVSPILHINSNFPKAIIISSEVDLLHNSQSVIFAQKLEEIGVSYEKVFIDKSHRDAVHGFLVDYKLKCTTQSIESILDFLKS